MTEWNVGDAIFRSYVSRVINSQTEEKIIDRETWFRKKFEYSSEIEEGKVLGKIKIEASYEGYVSEYSNEYKSETKLIVDFPDADGSNIFEINEFDLEYFHYTKTKEEAEEWIKNRILELQKEKY